MCYDRDKKLKHTAHVKMGSKFPIPPQPPILFMLLGHLKTENSMYVL